MYPFKFRTTCDCHPCQQTRRDRLQRYLKLTGEVLSAVCIFGLCLGLLYVL